MKAVRPASPRWAAGAWACLLAIVGCGSSPGGTEDPCADPVVGVQVGTGDTSFQALADGDPVTMVHGPQGGWHVWASMRLTAMTEYVTVVYTLETVEDGVMVSDNTYRYATLPEDECHSYYPGMYGYLDVSALAEGDLDTPPELLSYQELWMRIDVTDFDGATASAERRVVAQPDPADLDMVP